jgi:GT2 family glycosyltransferase
MLKAAIVILNWNGKKYLENHLPGIIRHSAIEGIAIYIADNGSTDGSVVFIEENFPTVKLIQFDRNYGFSSGYNKALSVIDAEYFILLNSDVEVTQGWISSLMEVMDNDPSVAACMPKIKAYNNKEQFEYAGASGGFIDKFGFPFCRGRIFNIIEMDSNQYDDSCETFWASGACMLIRASLFRKAGGLDDDFFAHMEEIDLCWRLKNMGYKIMVLPRVEVYHVGGGTLPNNNPHKLFLNFRNNLWLLFKNVDNKKLYRVLFFRLLFDIIAAMSFLFSFRPDFFYSVLKAHHAFFRSIGELTIKRKRNFQFFIKSDHNEIYPHSIVFQFFIKDIKTFNNLKF